MFVTETAQAAHKAVLIGDRSKLLWRTNTRLDILLYSSNDEVIIVQTSSKGPIVVYPLVYLDYKAIVKFVESQLALDSEQKKQYDKKKDTEKK